MSDQRRRTIGALGESVAAEHLLRGGYRVLARNHRTRLGEVDLIVADRDCIVFCEVRTRRDASTGGPDGPLDSIGPLKRRRLRRLAREWLADQENLPRAASVAQRLRFDAIGVTIRRDGGVASLEHVRDAF